MGVDIRSVSVVLLAAGLSRRFGEDDKLIARLAGKSLIEHVASTLGRGTFYHRFAVVREPAGVLKHILTDHGFELVVNDKPEEGMSRSIQLGMTAAASSKAIIIALGDMPFVPLEHYEALCERLSPTSPIVASRGAHGPMVPAAFMASAFPGLMALAGDSGARALIAQAPTIPIAAELLADIDYPDQVLGSPIRQVSGADPGVFRA